MVPQDLLSVRIMPSIPRFVPSGKGGPRAHVRHVGVTFLQRGIQQEKKVVG